MASCAPAPGPLASPSFASHLLAIPYRGSLGSVLWAASKHLSFPTKPACGHRLLLQQSSASSSSAPGEAPPSSSSLRPRPSPHGQIISFSLPSFPPEFQHVGRDARPWSRVLCMPASSSNSLGVFSISPFPGVTSWLPSLGDRGQVRGGTWAAPALLLRWLCALARELGWGNGAENIFIFFLLFFFFLFPLFFFLFPKD